MSWGHHYLSPYSYRSGNALFHGVLASLMVAQLAEYLRQIMLYRTAV